MTTALDYEIPAYQRADGLWVFSRYEFASSRFDYKPGEHLCLGGPTQHGKTTLAFQLLRYAATPECPVFVAVSKPEDPTTAKAGRELGYRRVTEWPTTRTVKEVLGEKSSGYLVWPKFGDINRDMDRSYKVTQALIADRYAAGARQKKGILFMDDTMVKSKLLGLDREMTTLLAMSGAMGLGLWVAVQKPTDSGRTAIWSYGAAEHLLLTYDPDRNNQKRYDEIGGVDPRLVSSALTTLEPYQFLYIKRTGRFMCIVGKK